MKRFIFMVMFAMLLVLACAAGQAETVWEEFPRGLVNEPLDGLYNFFDRYDSDEYISVGDGYANTHYTDGWSWAHYLCAAGYEPYIVVNCNVYVSARAEADSSAQILQSFYLGDTVGVTGFWRNWALCVCETYDERCYVCGWVKIDYLVPEDQYLNTDYEYAAGGDIDYDEIDDCDCSYGYDDYGYDYGYDYNDYDYDYNDYDYDYDYDDYGYDYNDYDNDYNDYDYDDYGYDYDYDYDDGEYYELTEEEIEYYADYLYYSYYGDDDGYFTFDG